MLSPPDVFLNSSTGREAALYDATSQASRTYAELREEVHRLASVLDCARKALIFCFCRNDIASLTWYLAGLESGHAMVLLSAELPAQSKAALIEAYRPEFITSPVEIAAAGTHEQIGPSNHLWRAEPAEAPAIHPDLCLLLSTSGSTGSSKFVRLSAANIRSNAESIILALGVRSEDRAITSLPFHYSYGLSVINTHLLTGAALVLSDRPLTSPEFWASIRENNCTSFAGVPYSYEILNRLGLENLNVPSLHTLTQAGGKLRDDLIADFANTMDRRSGRFFVMYGQTEASARISVLPSHLVSQKLGSVGLPIPGGKIEIDASAGGEGELIYSGPNVMMSYASCREDLALGDVLGGKLYTGDRARIDPDGFLYITGRLKRDAKLFGMRLNLDEIEAMLRVHGPTAVVHSEGSLRIFCEYGDEEAFAQMRGQLAARLMLHHRVFQFQRIEQLPLKSSGKIDYEALQARR